MENLEDTCVSLRTQIAATEAQLEGLKRDLANAEAAAKSEAGSTGKPHKGQDDTGNRWPLLPEEYKRYGRQMIVPQIGLQGSLDCAALTEERKMLTVAFSFLYRTTQTALR